MAIGNCYLTAPPVAIRLAATFFVGLFVVRGIAAAINRAAISRFVRLYGYTSFARDPDPALTQTAHPANASSRV